MYMAGCEREVPVLLLAALIVGCSSTPSFEGVEFEQWVADNASKRFIFSVPFGGGAGGGPRDRMSVEEIEDKLLDAYMAEVAYCSDGYFVYARNFAGRLYRLEGECQESSN